MLTTFVNFFNIVLITLLIAYVIFWSRVFMNYSDKFNNTIQATITEITCNVVCGTNCNKSNVGTTKDCGVFCNVEMIRDDVDIYMCEMTVRYTIGIITYNRKLIVIGHSLYFKDQIINIQYDLDNPFDIRIAQPTYNEIGISMLIISIALLFVLWLTYISVIAWQIS